MRDRQAEGLGGLEVDHQLELRRLFNWQISGPGTLNYLVHVRCAASRERGHVDTILQETSELDQDPAGSPATASAYVSIASRTLAVTSWSCSAVGWKARIRASPCRSR